MRPRAGRRPLDAALIYARRGWPVFPCQSPSSAGGCSCHHDDCASPAKHPRIQGGLRAATTEEAQLRQWWARWPDANVAVRTGTVSGLVVLDVDPDHGGDDSLERLLDRFGPLPDGRLVRTGSGGRHFYFAHPGGTVRNDTGRRLGPGLDVRGDGGYVIAPPSRHASGESYVLEASGQTIPELPGWLIELLRPPPTPKRHPVRPSSYLANPDRWTRAAVDGGGRAAWISVGHYVRVQIVVALIDAIGVGVVALVLGLPFVVPIAVLVFLSAFIPFVGAIVTGGLAVLVALVYAGPVPAVVMLAGVIGVNQLESHILQPLLMGTAVRLHPVAVVLAVSSGSILGGIGGAVFAVPVAAAMNSAVKYLAGGSWKDEALPPTDPMPREPENGGRRARRRRKLAAEPEDVITVA